MIIDLRYRTLRCEDFEILSQKSVVRSVRRNQIAAEKSAENWLVSSAAARLRLTSWRLAYDSNADSQTLPPARQRFEINPALKIASPN